MGRISSLFETEEEQKREQQTPAPTPQRGGRIAQLFAEELKDPRQAVRDKIQAGQTPSRRDMNALGVGKTSAKQRKIMAEAVRRQAPQPTGLPSLGGFAGGGPAPELTTARPETPTDPVPQAEGDPSFLGQLAGGEIELAAFAADIPRNALRLLGNIQPGGLTSKQAKEITDKTIKGIESSKTFKLAENASKRAKVGRDFLLKRHPEWQADPPESFTDLIKSPSKLGKNVLRAVPLLANAGFAIAAGQPIAATTLMFAAEKGSAKENFIAKGASEKQADEASDVYGVIAAGLETLQVGQGLKLLGATRNIILNRAVAKITAAGAAKTLSKRIATTAILEAVEEMGQGTAEDLVGLIKLNQPIEGGAAGFASRRAQEALIATTLSLLTSGVGVSAGLSQKAVEQAQTKKELQRAAKELGIPVKGLSREAILKKLEFELGRIELAQADIQQGIEGRTLAPEVFAQVTRQQAQPPTAEAPGAATAAEQVAPTPEAPQVPIEAQPTQRPPTEAVTETSEAAVETEALEDPVKPENRLFSRKTVEAAKERLRDAGTLRSGIDTRGLADMVIVGADFVETGVRNFSAWSQKMIETFGEEVKPRLDAIWKQVNTSLEKSPKKGTKIRTFLDTQKKEEAQRERARKQFRKELKKTQPKTSQGRQAAAQVRKQQAEKVKQIPGGESAVAKLTEAAQNAIELRPLVESEIKAGRRKKFGAALETLTKDIAKTKGADIGRSIRKAKGVLKGKLSGRRFAPIRDSLEKANPGIVNKLKGVINEHKPRLLGNIMDGEVALDKLLDGEPNTLREVRILRDIFGLELADLAKSRVQQATASDIAYTLWRAGLLTGLKTSMLNTSSNLFHAVSETASDLPAAAVDTIIAQFTGKRTLAFTVRGIPGGIIQGGIKGYEFMKTGIDERNAGEKFDFVEMKFVGKPATTKAGKTKQNVLKGLQAYEQFIFHMMGAEDQPFYYGAKARSMVSQAIASAKTKKLKGAKRAAHVRATLQNPSQDMIENAIHDAEAAVFQNRTLLGDIARAMQKAPVLRWVVPFSRTPSAVAMQIINYSPVGPMIEVSKQISKREFNQRNFAKAIGRSVVGIPALATGAALFAAGMMALDFPDDKRERKLWELEGRKPNSIKIGGKWRSVFVLGPLGNVLLIGGYFKRALEESGSPTEAITTAMAGSAKSFTDQTFVTGMSQAAAAINDPETRALSFFKNQAGSIVPTLIRDIANAQDIASRRTKNVPEGFIGRIPLWRRTLEPRVDVFGNDLPRYGGNVIEVMIDPTRPSKVRQDVVVDEVRRLWDNKVRVSPTQLGNKNGYDSLTDEENTLLWRDAGKRSYQAIFDRMQRPAYKNNTWSDERKGKEIEKVVKKAKDLSRAQVAAFKLKQGKTMLELKDSGLVTEDVEKLIKRFN